MIEHEEFTFMEKHKKYLKTTERKININLILFLYEY